MTDQKFFRLSERDTGGLRLPHDYDYWQLPPTTKLLLLELRDAFRWLKGPMSHDVKVVKIHTTLSGQAISKGLAVLERSGFIEDCPKDWVSAPRRRRAA